MTNPTSNYGFVLPTATDLVTDLPADFEVALQGVDTRLKALQPGTTLGDLAYSSATADTNTRLPIGTNGQVLAVVAGVPAWQNGQPGDIEGVTAGTGITGGGTSGTVTITNDMATTITASGDIVVGTGSGTYDNLPIGTTNQVLTADTTVSPYKVKWATPSAPAKSYSLLNSGGTALTGAATITVSSISGINDLLIVIVGMSAVNSNSTLNVQINGDTASNYQWAGPWLTYGSGFDPNNFSSRNGNFTSLIRMGQTGSTAGTALNGYLQISGANSTGVKAFTLASAGDNIGGNGSLAYWLGGIWNNTATISSINFISGNGNFDAGTVYIYGAA